MSQLAPLQTDDLDPYDLAAIAALAASEKKAERPVVLDVGDLLGIVDAFVIVSAGNTRLVATIAEAVEEQVKAVGGPAPVAIEGLRDAEWVLMDYGSVVVHIFLDETREFYDLERLWKDAPRRSWE